MKNSHEELSQWISSFETRNIRIFFFLCSYTVVLSQNWNSIHQFVLYHDEMILTLFRHFQRRFCTVRSFYTILTFIQRWNNFKLKNDHTTVVRAHSIIFIIIFLRYIIRKHVVSTKNKCLEWEKKISATNICLPNIYFMGLVFLVFFMYIQLFYNPWW